MLEPVQVEKHPQLRFAPKIKKLIAEENPRKPLSDNTIANLLKEEGIDVARRTVAKYRESLNIPSSSERKSLDLIFKIGLF